GERAVGAVPGGDGKVALIFEEMTERVATGQRPADELPHAILSAQTTEAGGMIGGQTMVIPTDRAAHLNAVGVDPAGRVVCGRDAARNPMIEAAQLPQTSCHRPHTGAGLSLQLHHVQFGNAPLGPEVSRQAYFREPAAIKIKRQTLHSPGAEIPARDDALRRDTTKRFRHSPTLLSPEVRRP